MKRFWIVQAIIILCAILMTVFSASDEPAILGMKPFCMDGKDPCWIAVSGTGVITLGVGVGVIFYGVWGAGVLFGIGQATCGLIAFGQVAAGGVFCCAQLGFGLSGVGQLMFGGRLVAQGAVGWNGTEFLKALNSDLDRTLTFL